MAGKGYDAEQYAGRARHPSGVPFLTRAEILDHPAQPYEDALNYIRYMQRTSTPCIPFLPLSRIVCEMAQNFTLSCAFKPEALRVVQAMLETYLVELFAGANVACIHGGGRSHCTFPFTGFADHADENAPTDQGGAAHRSLAVQGADLLCARRI